MLCRECFSFRRMKMTEKISAFSPEDEGFMRLALQLAEQAAREDEVPIGAVLV